KLATGCWADAGAHPSAAANASPPAAIRPFIATVAQRGRIDQDLLWSRTSPGPGALSIEFLSGSFIAFLKPRIASPSDLPKSGSLVGPNTIRATRKITHSSGAPRLPNIETSAGIVTLCHALGEVNAVFYERARGDRPGVGSKDLPAPLENRRTPGQSAIPSIPARFQP